MVRMHRERNNLCFHTRAKRDFFGSKTIFPESSANIYQSFQALAWSLKDPRQDTDCVFLIQAYSDFIGTFRHMELFLGHI